MNGDTLKQILQGKTIELIDNEQDASIGLRLFVNDPATRECGVLAIEPCQLALPEEIILDYSYEMISEPPMPHFDECDYNFQPETLPVDLRAREGGLF